MSRNLRIALAAGIAVALGVLGYRQWQASDPAPAQQTAAAAQAAPTRLFGRIPFEPCVVGGQQGLPPLEAYCGTFDVPEDRSRRGGRTIALDIAWLPAEARGGGAPDPVFFLAGGPGQAATDVANQVDMALRDVRRQRDVLLVDQRGTGGSNPLDCRDDKGAPLAFEEAASQDEAGLVAYAERCLASLRGRADPRFYTTGEAILDLDAVRAAIGAERINVVGGSYGTRVAQQYAMRFPERVRTVVLDGVAPNDLVVGGEFARRLDEALRKQDAQCARIQACKARYGEDLPGRLRALKQRLAQTPVEVAYLDPATNAPRRDTLTDEALVGLVHGVSYLPQLSALLPLVVAEAEQGRYGSLMSLAHIWSDEVGGQLNRGMQWSVVCAEDAQRYQPDPADAATVLGPDMARMFYAACQVWPRGVVAKNFHAPFRADAPVLLLSGELDPVTPPAYGERVAKGLPNARHLVLRGQGHGAMAMGCMPKLLGRFIESADPAALEAGCLDSLGYVPPFTTFNGWEP